MNVHRADADKRFDEGDLIGAIQAYQACERVDPGDASVQYMLGLCHKYLLQWEDSLRHNLAAINLGEEHDPAAVWNAGIAATALGRWDVARQAWEAEGIPLPDGDGPIEADFGYCCVFLNPWSAGETIFARRIDPVRARIEMVPLPDSGFRYQDVVFHDGASIGSRCDGEQELLVFGAFGVQESSGYSTFTVELQAPSPEDVHSFIDVASRKGLAEDWSETIRYICQECSRTGGASAHEEHAVVGEQWLSARTIGVAARTEAEVDELLDRWVAGGGGRAVEAVYEDTGTVPSRPGADAGVWWV